MNILQQQEALRSLPEQFLQKELLSPTGAAPSFLVLSELQRRDKMRRDYASRTGAESDKTMAEEYASGLGRADVGSYGDAMRNVMAPPPGQPPQGMTPPPAQQGAPMEQMASLQGMPPQGMPQPETQSFAEGGGVLFDRWGRNIDSPQGYGNENAVFPLGDVYSGMDAFSARELARRRGNQGAPANSPVRIIDPPRRVSPPVLNPNDPSNQSDPEQQSPVISSDKGTLANARANRGILREDIYPKSEHTTSVLGRGLDELSALAGAGARAAGRGLGAGVRGVGHALGGAYDLVKQQTEAQRAADLAAQRTPRTLEAAVDNATSRTNSRVIPQDQSLVVEPPLHAPERVQATISDIGSAAAPAAAVPPPRAQAPADPAGGGVVVGGLDPGGAGAGGGGGGLGDALNANGVADFMGTMRGLQLPDRYGDLERQNQADKDKLVGQRDENRGMALVQAGLGMMAGESPFAAVNIGRGAQAGVKYWQEAGKELRVAEQGLRQADQTIAIARANRDERQLETGVKLKMHFEEKKLQLEQIRATNAAAAGSRADALDVKKQALKVHEDDLAQRRGEATLAGYQNGYNTDTARARAIDADIIRAESALAGSPNPKALEEQIALMRGESAKHRASAFGHADSYNREMVRRDLSSGKAVMASTKPGYDSTGKKMLDGQVFYAPDGQRAVWRDK